MARPKLDGAGIIKLETLDHALTVMQSVHGIVENMALAVRNETPTTPHVQRLRRTVTPLVGLLKGQFGTISDSVAAMMLAATRGASERNRVRTLRENVASIRMHIEAAQSRVIEIHSQESPRREEGTAT
jgi:hypothetical protein